MAHADRTTAIVYVSIQADSHKLKCDLHPQIFIVFT